MKEGRRQKAEGGRNEGRRTTVHFVHSDEGRKGELSDRSSILDARYSIGRWKKEEDRRQRAEEMRDEGRPFTSFTQTRDEKEN